MRVLAQCAHALQRRIEVRPLGGLALLPGGIAQTQVLVGQATVARDRVEDRRLA